MSNQVDKHAKRVRLAARTPGLSVGKAMRLSGGERCGKGRATAPAFAIEQALERVIEAAQDVSNETTGDEFDKGRLFAYYCCADWMRWQMTFASKVTATRWKSRLLPYFDPDSLLRMWSAASAGKRRRWPRAPA